VAVILLYPLERNSKGVFAARSFAALIVFPSMVSIFYLIFLIFVNNSVVVSILTPKDFPIIIGIIYNATNTPIILSTLIAFVILILFLPQKKFVNALTQSALSLAAIVLISSSTNLLFSAATFSIGSILLIYLLLFDQHDPMATLELTSDFLWQRFSDLIIFAALILALSESFSLLVFKLSNQNHDLPMAVKILFFAAIAMKCTPIHLIRENSPYSLERNSKEIIIYHIFVGISAQILFLFFSPALLNDANLNKFFMLIAAAILFFAVYLMIKNQDKENLEHRIINLLTCATFLITCGGFYRISLAMICGLIIFHPLLTLSLYSKGERIFPTSIAAQTKSSRIRITVLEGLFFELPNALVKLLAGLFTKILNPLYSVFLLLRLPQIILSILQTPLRFFHTGNIQRSLLFTAITLYFYFALWGQKWL